MLILYFFIFQSKATNIITYLNGRHPFTYSTYKYLLPINGYIVWVLCTYTYTIFNLYGNGNYVPKSLRLLKDVCSCLDITTWLTTKCFAIFMFNFYNSQSYFSTVKMNKNNIKTLSQKWKCRCCVLARMRV